jgi:hypothetical protein
MAEIDILRMELEEKLPYWLSPEAQLKGKLDDKVAAIREKHQQVRMAELRGDLEPSG